MSRQNHVSIGCGCGTFTLGGVFAFCTSMVINQSVLWALLHSIFSYFYILYALAFQWNKLIAGIRHIVSGT